MSLTPKELEIQERCEKATPEPWELWNHLSSGKPSCIYGGVGRETVLFIRDPHDEQAYLVFNEDDLAFLLKARADIPTLLSTVSALRDEIERLKAALTPSAETKAAYMGEFYFDEHNDDGATTVIVPWTTIKEIMSAIFTYAGFGRVEPCFKQAEQTATQPASTNQEEQI